MARTQLERKHKKNGTKQMDIRDGWGLRTKRRMRPHRKIQIISTDENKNDMKIRTHEMGWEQDNRTGCGISKILPWSHQEIQP
eukprot:9118709-Ditylum_brightwellii.AAC.1